MHTPANEGLIDAAVPAGYYFDVYNTGTTKHHNVPAEVHRLQGRIAQFHFKNGDTYLDDEQAKFEPIAAAIKEIGYQGWIVLETSSPSQNAVADAKRNGDYVRMVERCQAWHLPDPADPRPIAQGIKTYVTRLRVGSVDFAILEDRKFKTGPNGLIPQMGPRPDHRL